MASPVSSFIRNEILRLSESEMLNEDDTLSSLGFSSKDFAKIWESAKARFPELNNTEVTQFAMDASIQELLERLSSETSNIKQ